MKDICPHCSADLIGEPIAAKNLHLYGSGATHYYRYIGHEVPRIYDGVLFWSCPDCLLAWGRDFSSNRRLSDLSRDFVEQHNAESGITT